MDDSAERMQTRTEPLAFGLTLAVSLVLHGGFFYALPGVVPPSRPPTADTVFVELPPPGGQPTPKPVGAQVEASPPETEPEQPAQEAAAPEEPPQAQGPTPAPEPRTPLPAPTLQPRTQPAAPAPESRSAAPGNPPPAAGAAPDASRHLSPAALQDRPLPVAPPAAKKTSATERAVATLKELLPSRRDLARFQSASLPDPSNGTAREAAIGLGEVDVRYRGYIDQVHGAIYAAWHVGRGLLVAGGSRRVVVRFSLNSMGMVQDAEVVEPSGNPTLDTEAVDALKRGRLPPFPAHWTLERLSLMAQFDYVFQ